MTKKRTFSAFRMMPKAIRRTITDSLLLDSGTEVVSATVDGYDVFIRVCGNVKVQWGEDAFKTPSGFPQELQDAIRDHSVFDRDDAEVIESNWYELFIYGKGEDGTCLLSELVDIDISQMTPSDARLLISEWVDFAENR